MMNDQPPSAAENFDVILRELDHIREVVSKRSSRHSGQAVDDKQLPKGAGAGSWSWESEIGQAVDRQGEWTVERSEPGVSNPMARIMQGDKVIIGWTMRPFSESFDKILDAHNAALAANDEQWRERFRKFEKIEEKFGPASQRSEGQVVHYWACSEQQSDKLRDNIIARERYLKSQYAAREYWRWKYCDPVIRRVKVGASPTPAAPPAFFMNEPQPQKERTGEK